MIVTPKRRGHIKVAWLTFLASAAILAGLVALLFWDTGTGNGPPENRPLLVYCAAGLKAPVEAAARAYERDYGVAVQLQYGGSQTLLAGLQVSRRGDLYIPGDESYLQTAHSKDLIDETIPLAQMTPVLAIRKGNPRKLHTLADALKEGVRLSCANPDAAAVGKLTRVTLEKAGRWNDFKERVVVYKPTVNDVANDVAVGAVDAGVVWDATVRLNPGLEMVRLPELSKSAAHITVAVLHSKQPTASLRFARYLAARDKGLALFKEKGFEVVEGDLWAETPELLLFAGAMLRPAIRQTIQDFERREGVRVQTVYNGCGILVAQMKTGSKRPDAYFACDQSFMTQVADLFRQPVAVSTNRLVILVKKGNPHDIHTLDDLGKEGLRVGVGHEKQCAMGALTQETLRQDGSRKRVMNNVKTQAPTGDLLVNELLTGALDAAIVYVSNAHAAGDKVEAIAIDIPCALAVQPLAVSRASDHRQLTERLANALRTRTSRERFEDSGFRWKAQGK